MIITKDLRQGNWVYPNEENATPYKVFGIINDEMIDFGLSGFNGRVQILASELEPIPITKEILMNAGFKKEKGKSDYEWIYNKTIIEELIDISVAKDGDEIHVFLFSGDCLRHIKNVHQLQNLFYSITGNELEIEW